MAQDYCESHGVDVEQLDGHDRCPYCKLKADREAMEYERATRHAPRSVDDPASVGSYRR